MNESREPRYMDALGQPLDVSGGDRVSVAGFDGEFETVNLRPEGVAVIRNLAPGYVYTSTISLRNLIRVEG